MATNKIITESRKSANVRINWDQGLFVVKIIGTETIDSLCKAISKILPDTVKDSGFYMLYTKVENTRELKYIGLTYDQSLNTRPAQKNGHESAYKCIIDTSKGENLYLKLGKLIDSDLGKNGEELYEDIEKCLICCNKPSCNDKLKDQYYSDRESLMVTNEGYYLPLRTECTCKAGQNCV